MFRFRINVSITVGRWVLRLLRVHVVPMQQVLEILAVGRDDGTPWTLLALWHTLESDSVYIPAAQLGWRITFMGGVQAKVPWSGKQLSIGLDVHFRRPKYVWRCPTCGRWSNEHDKILKDAIYGNWCTGCGHPSPQTAQALAERDARRAEILRRQRFRRDGQNAEGKGTEPDAGPRIYCQGCEYGEERSEVKDGVTCKNTESEHYGKVRWYYDKCNCWKPESNTGERS